MSETVDTPDEYVADDLETALLVQDGIDALVNPGEAGQANPGHRPGTKEQRAERWDRLTDLFTELRDEIKEYDHVLKMKLGYTKGPSGRSLDHSIGFVVVTGVGGFSGGLPEEVTEKTLDEELRLVDMEVGDRYPDYGEIVAFQFALPPIETDESAAP